MRVELSAVAVESGWRVEIAKRGTLIAAHEMAKLPKPPWVAPARGLDEKEAFDVTRATARVYAGSPTRDDQEAVGRHLFDSLIGEVAWAAIKERASAEDERFIELALSWASTEVLNGVRWELMHDGTSFLAAAGAPRAVAIVRVVTDVADPKAPPPSSITAPARVLFVIGSALADSSVRAGAEIMGLLRPLEREGAAIQGHVLENANLRRLERAVNRIRPDIVHFVSHGRETRRGGELRFRNEADHELDAYVDLAQLLPALTGSVGLPRMVVITACHSASATPASGRSDSRSDPTAPLAAGLVRAGVPVVVGMAGHVSDLACRLFVQSFGGALATGGALIEAVTHGRRAAMWSDGGVSPRGDWALPTVFVAPSVATDHVPVDAAVGHAVLRRIAHYGLTSEPVFCGRHEFLRRLHRLVDADDRLNVVNAYVDPPVPGVGKSRLLEELADRALREGHIVVLINNFLHATDTDHPKDTWAIASILLRGIVGARVAFGLKLPHKPGLVEFMAETAGVEASEEIVDDSLRQARLERVFARRDVTVSAEELKHFLAFEFAQLAREARAERLPGITERSRVLVLLDEVDQWDVHTLEILHGAFGFGTVDEPVPVFMTSSFDVHRQDLQTLRTDARGHKWISYTPLKPLEAPEDALACHWVLLNPRSEDFVAQCKFVEAGMVIAAEPGDETWSTELTRAVEGIPENFSDDWFYALAATLVREKILKAGKDRAVLARYLEGLAG